MILIYATFKDDVEAKTIIKHLIEKKLIACGNFYPVTSIYEWKGKQEESSEMASILKAKKENFNLVKAEIEKMHSYEVPCIIKLDVEANIAFKVWVNS